MKNKILIVGLLAVAWFGYRHFSEKPAFIANLKPLSGTIIAFGDSLTAGQGANSTESYPAVLGEFIGIDIVNAGKNGDTLQSALERLDGEVLEQKPQVVIMTLGGNDIMRRVSVEQSVEAAAAIFTKLIGAGAMVIFIEIDPPLFASKRMKAIRAVAEPLGVVWLDGITTGLWGNSKVMADNIHPNAAGYRIMAERIHEKLKNVLK